MTSTLRQALVSDGWDAAMFLRLFLTNEILPALRVLWRKERILHLRSQAQSRV